MLLSDALACFWLKGEGGVQSVALWITLRIKSGPGGPGGSAERNLIIQMHKRQITCCLFLVVK